MEIKDTYIEYPKYDDSEFNIKISTKIEKIRLFYDKVYLNIVIYY